MAKRKHLINVHTSTGTTAPTGASLYLGEIAVQHKATDPALWIKVGAAESSTQYEKFVGEKAVTSAISQAVSSSLTGVSMNGSEVSVTNKVATLGTVITAETQLSTATTGTGNVVGSIAVSNHKITATMFSAASADQISKLSGATTAHTANTTMHVTSTERTRWNNAWTSGVSAYTKVEALSAATTGISSNLNKLSAGTISLVASSAVTVFSSAKTYTDNEIGKLDSTGQTSDANHYLTSVTITNGIITAVGEEAVPSESSITTATSGGGNVISNITATGHQLTLVKSVTAATSAQVSTLSAATHSHITNGDIHVTAAQKTNWTNSGTSGANAYVGYIAHSANTGIHVTTAEKNTWNGKQDKIDDLSTIRNNALSGASAYTRVDALSAATTAHTANTTVHVTANDKTKWNAAITGVTSAGTGNSFTEYSVANNILTLKKGATYLTTAATTTQGGYADSALQIVSGSTYIEMSAKSGGNGAKMQTATVKQQGVETASATGQGLADAYDVKQYVESLVTSSVDYKGATATLPTTSTVGDMYITTAQIALTAAQSATGAAQTAETGDFIIARSAGKWDVIQKNLDGAVTGSLTADTVTLGSGTHTVKSLANGSNGQVLAVVSNKPAWTSAVKVNSATTADSATNATNATNAVSATTSLSANTAAALTGNITTGQVTNLTSKIQSTKVNSATTADSATNATNAVSATTSLSANVATNATKVNNHTVESDVPSNAVFTDTATTQGGHYTPSASASTEGSTTGFIQQIKLDSKKHVVGIVSGTTSYTETSVTTKNGTTGSTAAPVLSNITTGGTKGHELTLTYTNKVNSATTANSAVTSTSATTSQSADTSAALTGNITTGQVTNLTTKIQTTKVNSATTADSATNATNATNAVSATTSQSANTAAALTGNITTGQVTNLTTKIQTTKVNSATTADSATNATNAVSATTSLSANVATNATKVNNHTVNSDVPTNAVFTDTATTKDGHYDPGLTATTAGTSAAGGFIKAVKLDGKGHVTGTTTGTAITTETQLTYSSGSSVSNTASAVVTGLTVSNHAITYGKTNKVFSAGTADSAATLTGNITTGQVTDLAATIKATKVNSATTADSATNASKVNNHTVNSDVPASALFTDSATTETGHYSPTTSASTKGTTAATANFVKGIRIDSKNHVIDVVTGTVVTAQTQLTTATTGNGNVLTDLTVNNHQITKNFGMTIPSWATASTKPSYTLDEVSDGTTRKLSDYASSANVTSLSAVVVSNKTAVGKIAVTGVTITGTGNAVTNATYSNSALTLTKGNVQATITDLSTIRNNALSGASAYTNVNSLSAATTAHTANTTVHVTSGDKTLWNAAITGVTSAGTGNSFTDYSVSGNKLTLTKGATYLTTAATTTQGTRADSALQIVSGSTYIEMSAKSGGNGAKMQTATVKQQGVETASATGQGLADAYDVKQYVEGLITSSVNYKGATATLPTSSTQGDMYITTAQIALTASQSATGAAQTAETGDFIIARSSGKWDVIQKNLDGAITGSLTADTVTLGSGTHTAKSLANGSNGQVLAVVSNKPAWTSAVKVNSATTADSATNATNATNAVSATTSLSANVATNATKVNNHTVNSDVPANAVFTDTATTETGHYNIGTTVSKTAGSSAAGNFLKTVTFDSKGHYIGYTSGTAITSETQLSTGTTGNGNVMTDITVSNHKITKNYGMTIPSWATASTKPSYTLDEVTDGTTRKLSDYASSANVTSLSASVVSNKTAVGKIAVTAVTINGTGNAITGASYSSSSLTLSKGNVQATISDLDTIRARSNSGYSAYTGYIAHSADTGIHVTSAQKTAWTNGANSGASAWTAVTALSAATTAINASMITGITAGGSNVTVTNKVAAIPSASTNTFGVVKAGSFLTSTNGTLSVNTGTSNTTVAVGNHTHSNYATTTNLNALSAATTAHTANNLIHVTRTTEHYYDLLNVQGLYEEANAQSYALPGSDYAGDGQHASDTIILADTSLSAKTSHVLTMQLNGTQVGQYSPSANTTINMKVNGTNVMLTSAYTMNTGTSRAALEVTSADSTTAAFGKVSKVIYLDELITSSALNDLNDRVYELEQGGWATSEDLLEISGVVIDFETEVAQDISEINERIDSAITGNLSADTVTLGSGTHTAKSLANGSNGQVLSISSNKPAWVNAALTDTATTQGGHYTPSTSASTKGTTAATANYVKGIRIDSKNHVIDVVTGTVVTAQTSITTANGTTGNTAAAVITGITTGGTVGHQLTLNKSNKIFSASTSDSALTVTSAITSLSAQTAILGPAYTYSGLPYVNSATSIAAAYSALTNELLADEKVAAASMNDLNSRINELSGSTGGDASSIMLTGYHISCGSTEAELTVAETDSVNDAFGKIQKQMLDNEEAIAASLNDLNARISSVATSGLPAVTSSDNGKILRVVNGQWALVTPTTVLTGSGTPSQSLGVNGDIYLQS